MGAENILKIGCSNLDEIGRLEDVLALAPEAAEVRARHCLRLNENTVSDEQRTLQLCEVCTPPSRPRTISIFLYPAGKQHPLVSLKTPWRRWRITIIPRLR